MPGSEVPFTNPSLNDAEAVKIEALAEDIFRAAYRAPANWRHLEPASKQMWLRAATLAQDRIDAAYLARMAELKGA